MNDRLHKLVNGEKVYLSQEEEDAIRAEWAANEAAELLEQQDYRELRRKEYPSIQEQLDMLFHDKKDRTNTWFERIDSIKKKYPKNNT